MQEQPSKNWQSRRQRGIYKERASKGEELVGKAVGVGVEERIASCGSNIRR